MKNNISINKKNKYIWIVIVFAILLVGGTLASVISDMLVNNGRYNTVSTCLTVDYDITNDDGTMPITGALFPTVNFYGGLSGKVGLKINDSCSLEGIGSLYLNVSNNTSPIYVQTVDAHCEDSKTLETLTDYDDESACTAIDGNVWVTAGSALKYAVFDTNEISGETIPVSVGYVNKVGSIEIYNNIPVTKTMINFYVYIWLDGNISDNSYANLSFDGNVSASVVQKHDVPYDVTFDANGGEIELVEYIDIGEHEFVVPYDGEYKLEVWGAQGGNSAYNSYSYNGGYGGYSVGIVNLDANTNLYIDVGGKGQSYDASVGADNGTGYNGGGYATWWQDNSVHGGGGGATHIATKSGQLSMLSEYANKNNSPILIVAGGGGGSSTHGSAPNYSGTGGSGGGYIGSSGITANTTCYNYGVGGAQDSAGGYVKCSTDGQDNMTDFPYPSVSGFGYAGGFNQLTNTIYATGGGGYYGGGSGFHGPAGGGSGYIGNSLLTNKAMYCYNCTTSSDINTLTYTTTNVSGTATSNYAKSGNGAARITLTKINKKVYTNEQYGELPVLIREGYSFLGWNTKSDGTGITITSSTVVDLSSDMTLYAIWSQKKYTISYDANEGSNAPESQEKIHGITLYISNEVPTRDGYVFFGWSTSSTATSPSYISGSEFTINDNVILYAVWIQSPLYSYNCANGSNGTSPYYLTYTGNCTLIDDGNGNWRVKFLSSGDLTVLGESIIDAFLVGGGGSGGSAGNNAYGTNGGGGGGGGYTKTISNVKISKNESYTITIGGSGGTTLAFNNSAQGGSNGSTFNNSSSTSMGSTGQGGAGGNYGGVGSYSAGQAGNGGSGNLQTREFGESTGTLYAGGGGGGGSQYGGGGAGGAGGGGAGSQTVQGGNGMPNTGGGGGGGGSSNYVWYGGGAGGSGVVVIRNARIVTVNFTIDGKSFKAERNSISKIAWSDWISTSFNTNGYTTTSIGVTDSSGNGMLYDPSLKKYCSLSDGISDGVNYIMVNDIPKFSYTGKYQLVDDNDLAITTSTINWKVRFLTSGDMTLTTLGNASNGIDTFHVGGGGNGGQAGNNAYGTNGGGGGGGGYCVTNKKVTLSSNSTYSIVIGGSASDTSGFNITAAAGRNGGRYDNPNGTSMGSTGAGGAGSNYGGNGSYSGDNTAAFTQGKSGSLESHEFGETTGKLYGGGGGGGGSQYGSGGSGGAGGGGAGSQTVQGGNGMPNTGGGGGGGGSSNYVWYGGGAGGSGIIVIRNAR